MQERNVVSTANVSTPNFGRKEMGVQEPRGVDPWIHSTHSRHR